MGLLDILNSIQAGGVSNDPRARTAPASQGMSPTAKALLALLAIYADQLSGQTGMDRGDLLSELSQHLPRFVDQLTPDGRLPTEEEAARMV